MSQLYLVVHLLISWILRSSAIIIDATKWEKVKVDVNSLSDLTDPSRPDLTRFQVFQECHSMISCNLVCNNGNKLMK